MEDFFFGKVSKTKEGIYQLSLSGITQLGKTVSPDYFHNQLNRFLLKSNNYVDVYNGTSCPRFNDFLNVLSLNDIGKIEIGQRKDVNNNVEATLDCSIFLTNGIVRVTAHWCAWKSSRASEIEETLLTPLIEYGLIQKTFIKKTGGEVIAIEKDREVAIKQLFLLSGYPNAMN